MRWQKRARIGLAAFGLIVAITVYGTMGERQSAAPVSRMPGIDPSAVLESVGATFQKFRAATQDYVIEADRQLSYEGGATKFVGVSITVRQRAGRDFIISGQRAETGEGQAEIQLSGDVRLVASDGFVATADHAIFSQTDATLRVPGPISFQKGHMTGSGVGMTYAQDTDVLSLLDQARVTVTDDSGTAATEFRANAATLARLENSLTLNGSVHVLRGQQVLEADDSHVRLSTGVEFVTAIELRGNASVVGGGAFESMTAEDIDLEYTEDGAALERVLLSGNGAIVMNSTGGEAGREFAGDVLDLSFAPDASLTHATGKGDVRVALPGAVGAPARHVSAEMFDATGEPGLDLTAARFDEDVEYLEEATGGRGPRTVRSGTLHITFAETSVTTAVFSGSVQFEEQGLQASGSEARYDPTSGTLRLSGTGAEGSPRVVDEQIEIDADVIDVRLAGREMIASGSVTTVLYAGASGRLPGLLEEGAPVNVRSDTLTYGGGAGAAVYAGDATLWQGATAIRADRIVLDRASAGLVASGTARSTIELDLGEAVGRAAGILYDDAARTIIYDTPIATSTVAGATPAAQLSGPQGDIRAQRIEIVLGRTTSSAERLEAYGNVSANLGVRVATGDRLTYFAEDERYVMSGIANMPVTIVEQCRETSGRTMTFFKSTERIIVDGREEVRTQSRRGASCVATPAP
jgi:lipopolysaccharide export system protein LptA